MARLRYAGDIPALNCHGNLVSGPAGVAPPPTVRNKDGKMKKGPWKRIHPISPYIM